MRRSWFGASPAQMMRLQQAVAGELQIRDRCVHHRALTGRAAGAGDVVMLVLEPPQPVIEAFDLARVHRRNTIGRDSVKPAAQAVPLLLDEPPLRIALVRRVREKQRHDVGHPADLGDPARFGAVLQQLDLLDPVLEPLIDRLKLPRQQLGERHAERVFRIDQADEAIRLRV